MAHTKTKASARKRDSGQPVSTAGQSNGAHKIELVAPAALTAWPNNPMKHPKEQVELIIKSIKEFGFTRPILADENLVILAGHGAHMAASKMGLAQVPVIRLHNLTKKQKRAYVMADNKIGRGSEFDWKLVSQELQGLRDDDFDLDLTGFSATEIEPLLQATWVPEQPDDSSGTEIAEYHKQNIRLTPAEFSVATEAIAKVKKKLDSPKMTIGECIVAICKEYLKE